MKISKLSKLLTEDQILLLDRMNDNLVLLLEAELQQSDEDPDLSKDSEEEAPVDNTQPGAEEPVAQEQLDANGQPILSPEDTLMYELQGADDKFVQFALYNRLIELDNKIELLLINIQDGVGIKAKDFYNRLIQYKQYVEILNELIFSMSTSTIYKIVGTIELELIELLEQYTQAYNDNLIYDEARERIKDDNI